MMDFNFKFQRTWDRILVTVRPTPDHVFMYYLRSLHSEIALMIQFIGGLTLPVAYDIAIRTKNNLIQDGKLAPRPFMPIFPEVQPFIPIQIPPIATIHVPALDFQTAVQNNVVPANSDLQGLKDTQQQLINDQQLMAKLLQTVSNNLVSLKNQ